MEMPGRGRKGQEGAQGALEIENFQGRFDFEIEPRMAEGDYVAVAGLRGASRNRSWDQLCNIIKAFNDQPAAAGGHGAADRPEPIRPPSRGR
ncbi:hypothetical protein JCM31598_15870 [Desulfonatronum parangueonense]